MADEPQAGAPPARTGGPVARSGGVPVARADAPAPVLRADGVGPRKLTAAPVIYGVAGAALIVLAIYYIFSGAWFTGLLLLVPAGSLIGFAYVYLR